MSTHRHTHKQQILDHLLAHIREHYAPEQAPLIAHFATCYLHGVAAEDLLAYSANDVVGIVLSHWQFGYKRHRGQRLLRVYNPRQDEHGWQSSRTIIDIVTDDTPFLVDSLSIELNRIGLTVHLLVHPVLKINRHEQGHITHVSEGQDTEDAHHDAVIHIEVDRQSDPAALQQLYQQLQRVLDDVHAVVTDWRAMLDRLRTVGEELRSTPPPVDPNQTQEDIAFLEWLGRDHFTLLGFRAYRLENNAQGKEQLLAEPGSGLGILRADSADGLSRSFAGLPDELRKLARKPELLIITKTNTRATVHRSTHMDYVGIRRFNAHGEVVGEWRFLGLYTSAAYTSRPTQIPLIRRKVQTVLQQSGFRPRGHSAKSLANILDTLPRGELFQASAEELLSMAISILHLQERPRVRLLVRRDPYARFMSILVYLPRERFNTEVRTRIQNLLQRALNAHTMDFTVALSESPLARLYFIAHTNPTDESDIAIDELEAQVAATTRTWSDELAQALSAEWGEERGQALHARYHKAFPASYREAYSTRAAVADIHQIEQLGTDNNALGMSLYHPLNATPGLIRFKLFRRERPIALAHVLPMLENMGVQVLDEHPHEIHPEQSSTLWIQDLGMTHAPDVSFADETVRRLFQDAFARVWQGQVENDGFNKLVLAAQLPWRDVIVLRACCKYLRQTAFAFSQSYMEQALLNQPQIAGMIVDLFHARFDPALQERSVERIQSLVASITHSLEAVPNLDEDRILRRFLLLLQAMLRTNHYQTTAEGAPKDYLSFKLDPSQFPDLPNPRPMFEIFIYSRRMEGIHLRGGKVARGGLRWSDRFEDFRTEIFHLMKTQTVKNTVIVPVGAKGGFVVKQPPTGDDREALSKEVKACYSMLIRGLLDITDNLVGDRIVPPPSVVRYDGDDPYLVVAADKGTATFSDLANRIAEEYKFWLGDAFASGGSAGYDHKKIAITARGGWESVKRFFREMGRNIQGENFTVVGIGGMSGDVFGNGMLLSPHIQLVAAFSHSHIFVDPNPDVEASFRERQRLFDLPRSNWTDYNQSIISAGGGIYSRSAKSIAISPEARHALGIEAESLPPNEFIRAILKAPVDLLWNGGIGTFVKASHQNHVDVGDRSNDMLRVNANELRCKVIGEGGNLGFTAAARVEYALNGGRCNTDFIDNSAGVDCSDHEVNIKILLGDVIKSGALPAAERNSFLARMTDEVAELVLRDNYLQSQILSHAEHHGAALFDETSRLLRALEENNRLERATWSLPTDEELKRRLVTNQHFARSELCILLAASKMELFDQLLASNVCEDAYLTTELLYYFPTPIQKKFPDALKHHRLRRELIATCLTNSLINRIGMTTPLVIHEHTGATAADIARAFVAVRDIFNVPELWQQIEALDNHAPAQLQLTMLEQMRLTMFHAMLWFLRYPVHLTDIGRTVNLFAPGVAELSRNMPTLLDTNERAQFTEKVKSYSTQDVPTSLSTVVVTLPFLRTALDICDIAQSVKRSVTDVAQIHFAASVRLDFDWLQIQISTLPGSTPWTRLARSGLGNDLDTIQRSLTQRIIDASTNSNAIEAFEFWQRKNAPQVERYSQQLREFRGASEVDLALLTVAVNEARKLAAN